MRRLIVQEWVSLDGYTTDRNGGLDFFAGTVRKIYENNEHINRLEGIDCMLMGRKTYEQFAKVWPDRHTEGDFLAEKINTMEKIVFSNSVTQAPWGHWCAAKVESLDPVSSIKILKASPGKNIMVWGSITLVHLLMKNQLVDQYHTICPVLTGGGRRLFTESSDEITLNLKSCKQYDNGVVFLSYDIDRQKQ